MGEINIRVNAIAPGYVATKMTLLGRKNQIGLSIDRYDSCEKISKTIRNS